MTMYDETFQEINDLPAEIYDIPELNDSDDFNLNDYINGNYDY